MTAITNATPARSLTFAYDAAGNRVMKRDGRGKMTYYVRDAQGNVMAVYEKATATADIIASSFYIYGSSRIGELDENVNMRTAVVSTTRFSRIRGLRRYELSNHLGNVMAVVSDRKVIQSNGTYLADLVSSTDYYAFGMVMSDRSFNTEGYRYGFNGKENDNEVKGTGNQQDYGMRIYDARLGRFLSVDPIGKKFPFYTPYQFAGNKPIIAIDLDGLEDRCVVKQAFFEKIEYSIYENSDNTRISVVNFNTKSKELAVDFDGADVYHPNDLGLDYNSNGGIDYNSKTGEISGRMYGVAVDDNGKPIIQSAEQRSPGYYVSQGFVTVNGFTDNEPERYIDAVSIPYLAVSQEFLDATGAQWGDLGMATNKTNGKSVFFIIGDKKSSMKNIEMSYKMLVDLGISMVYTNKETYDKKASAKKVKSVKTTTKEGEAIYDIDIQIFRHSTIKDDGKKNGVGKGLNNRNLLDGLAKFYKSKLNKNNE